MNVSCVGFVSITFGLLIIAVYFAADYIYTNKQLRKHQDEWNQRKKDAINNGESLEDAYLEYLDYLMIAERHPLFGACLPRY